MTNKDTVEELVGQLSADRAYIGSIMRANWQIEYFNRLGKIISAIQSLSEENEALHTCLEIVGVKVERNAKGHVIGVINIREEQS